MTDNVIAEIEHSLGVKLPPPYRELLANYPYPDAPCSKLDLLNDPTSIIQKNLELRSNGYCGYDWPAEFLAIGDNGCGCVWFIQHSDPHPQVFLAEFDEEFPPETPQYEFGDFVERLGRENPWDDGPLPILETEFTEEDE